MSCYSPRRAFYEPLLNRVSFSGAKGDRDTGSWISVRCNRCFGCGMDKAKEWSLRCRHESMFWDKNAFVTLTYSDEYLPQCGLLDFKHLQDFLKRLRKEFKGVQIGDDKGHRPVRYFACGEYGSGTGRPHYHLLLFNIDFPNKKKIGVSKNGEPKYTSEALSKLWKFGNHEIGSVTPASASYCAGYATKKKYGAQAESHYEVIDFDTGEVLGTRVREDIRMSLRPALGQYWYDKYKSQLKHGFIVVDGHKMSIPRFYADKYKKDFPKSAARLKRSRQDFFVKNDVPVKNEFGVFVKESDDSRLQVKEVVAHSRRRTFGRMSEQL